MMNEQENVQIVQQVYADFGRGHIPAVLNALADDVEWFIPGPADIPFAGMRRGREEVAQFFAALDAAIEFEQFGAQDFVVQGNTVVAIGQDRRRARATGQLIVNHWAMVWELRDGKVTRFRAYEDTAAMVAAFRET
jgi:uncharacterized protein